MHKIIAIMMALLFCSLGAPARGDDPLIYSKIEPAQIMLGESARFTVTDLGSGTTPIAIPKVEGLQFELIGRTNQIEFVNGNTLRSTAIVMRVTPQMAGIFSIPGVTPKSQPVILQVSAPGAHPNAPGSAKAPAPYQAPILNGAALPKGVHLTEDGSAFVRINVPKREVYVGESVPVEIQLGLRSGFVTSVNGLPRLTGDNFTLNNLSRQPEREEKLIDGEPFVTLTWHSVLSVVKPGTFSLVAEAPLTVRIRTRPRRESFLEDQFGDPFLQNFFGATVPKEINASSPPAQLTVLALPTAGRPRDFHGAIGSFKVDSDVSPTAAEAGDPLTLRMRISGTGNFDRVDSDMLERADQWKTYPPRSSFSPGDASGRLGEKIFEQPVIALRAGSQVLPGLSFSYFDPNTRRYETARTGALSVKISPPLADNTSSSPAPASGGPSPANNSSSGLRPDHAGEGVRFASLVPLYFQLRFLAVPSLLALGLAAGWIGTRRRAKRGLPAADERLSSKAAQARLTQLDRAARAGETARFFSLAREAIQQAPGGAAGDQGHVPNEEIQRLLALADESKYSGRPMSSTDFAHWTRVVRMHLAAGPA